MELVYLRNCAHNNLVASDFYFSKKYQFVFGDTTLNCTKINHQNIFSDNLIITAIVGENGSGKSSLLNYIFEFCNKSYYPYEENANTYSDSDFMIYKKDELYIKKDIYAIVNLKVIPYI